MESSVISAMNSKIPAFVTGLASQVSGIDQMVRIFLLWHVFKNDSLTFSICLLEY